MREELENKLYEKYAEVLIDDGVKCHLDIGDGWYNLICAICDGVLTNKDNQESRAKYLTKNGRENEVKEYTPVKAVQIKEKFGGLRFYVSGGDEFDRGVIFTAENLSRRTCETCGDKGKTRDGGWMITLCDKHEDERRWRKENGTKTVLPDSGQVG